MHTVDRYLLKNTCLIFLLANIVAYLFGGDALFLWLNALALGLGLLLFCLIRLTVGRYADEFGKPRGDIKELLGRYIEDDRRGKVSFYDYLKRRVVSGTPLGGGSR